MNNESFYVEVMCQTIQGFAGYRNREVLLHVKRERVRVEKD